jgi:hypothetical protein
MAYFRKIDLEGSESVLDADTLDGHDSSYFATSTHNHDSAYVKLADYDDADVLTKVKNVDGSGSGLDADLLDGKHASDLVQIISSNTTKTVYGDGADFANLRDAFNWLKSYYILPGVTVTFSIPEGTFDATGDYGMSLYAPGPGLVKIAGAGISSTVLQFNPGYVSACYYVRTPGVWIQDLTIQSVSSTVDFTGIALNYEWRYQNPFAYIKNVGFDNFNLALSTNGGSTYVEDISITNAKAVGLRAYRADALLYVKFNSWPLEITVADGYTLESVIQSAGGAMVWLDSTLPGYQINVTGNFYNGVLAVNLAKVNVRGIYISGASNYDFAAYEGSFIKNNGGSGTTNITANTLSSDGSFIRR